MKFLHLYILLIILQLWSIPTNGQVKVTALPGQHWHQPSTWSPAGVPTANDTVVVYGYVNIEPGNNAYAKHLLIDGIGIVDIQRDIAANLPGRLFIDNNTGVGLINKNMIIVGGRLNIKNCQDTALVSSGKIEILDKAKLEIDSTYRGPGIFSSDLLVNYGSLSVSNTYSDAIINLDSLINKNIGNISITNNTRGVGIYNKVNSSFLNRGSVSITGGDDAVYNQGKLLNHGQISIRDTSDDGIYSSDTLSNLSTGIIDIHNNGGGYGLNCQSGSFCENYNLISIDTGVYGIYVNAPFYNYDTITFNSMSDWSFEIFDTLYNYDTGYIQSSHSTNGQIYSNGYLLNEGMIHTDNVYTGIENAESVVNYGIISCMNSTNDGIENGSLSNFENHGMIVIDSSGEKSIHNYSYFNNYDSIIITNATESSIQNRNYFENKLTGYISISNSDSIGVNNVDITDSLINNGTIVIMDMNNFDGAFLNNGYFYNSNVLSISNCNTGIATYGSLSEIVNHNLIEIQNSTSYSLLVEGSYIDNAGATLNISNTGAAPYQVSSGGKFDCFGIFNITQ